MPVYEYECPKCERVLEVLQKFSDPVLETCPDCNGPVRKLMSLSSFSLKGSGWYSTDYKKTSGPAGGGAAAKSESKAESVGESKASGESKAEAKSETKPAASAPSSDGSK